MKGKLWSEKKNNEVNEAVAAVEKSTTELEEITKKWSEIMRNSFRWNNQ